MPPHRRHRADRYRPCDNMSSGRTPRTTAMPYRDRRAAKVSDEQICEEQVDGDWVGSSLLSAMDRMELHVDEMLNAEAQPVRLQATVSTNSPANSTIRGLIYQEIAGIVDAAVTAHIGRPAATNLMSNSVSLSARDRRIVRDLDVLHRHEADLNKTLVERLFQVDAPTRELPEQRFARTTADLEGTDSVASVLVSHVEALVAKVEALQRRVRELETALANAGGGLPY